jgi:hypothetical protein
MNNNSSASSRDRPPRRDSRHPRSNNPDECHHESEGSRVREYNFLHA